MIAGSVGDEGASAWLALLGRLTAALPLWGLWKNADAALAGHGDFDSTAPVEDWGRIVQEFADWASDRGLGPVTACREVPGGLFLLALDREKGEVLELDVNARKYFRGWTMFRPRDLAPVMEIDDRGFRRVRPGAEGLILLVQNGLLWGGRPDPAGLARKRVAEFLRADPEGVRLASRMFGAASGAAERAAEAVAAGGWDRRAMLTLEAYAGLRALGEPGIAFGRLLVPARKRRCPVLRTIFEDDRRVADPERWIQAVSESHEVHHD